MSMSTSPMSFSFVFQLLLILIVSSSPFPVTSTLCNPTDKQALLAIKSSFNNTRRFDTWTPTTPCCVHWHGVRCDPLTARVTGLAIFQDTNLSGTIPPAIGLLSSLQTLTLHRLPNLVGPIPDSLANLTLLDLSRNSLTGRIPLFLSKLTSLTYINLAYNRLSSPIPGSLPYLPNLTTLHLEYNQLYGNIPNTFGSFRKSSSSAPELYLSHNELTGVIWPSLGEPDWGVIDISRNKLMGDASVLFGATKMATTIDISRNKFNFDVSNVSFPTSRLRVVDMSRNMIYGRIPDEINEVKGLERLDVSYNRLCGEIPAGSVTARFGKRSYVHHMCLCGAPLMPCT